jgi:multiple sugar transport system substrate-binding protein
MSALRSASSGMGGRRWRVRILPLLILAYALIGCEASREPRLVFSVGGTPAELLGWEKIIKEFQQRSGIPVEILLLPADTDQQRQSLIISLEAGVRNPDVFLMDVGWLGLFSRSGWLEPLTGVDPAPFFAKVIELADTYRGNLVALPVYMDGGLLYYRKDLLNGPDASGPPATWEELLSSSLRIQPRERPQQPDFYGFVWQGAQYEGLICDFLEFAGSRGGFAFEDGRIEVNTPENRRALQFMHDLIWKYKISPPNTYTEMKEEQARLYFQRGAALYERNWPYAWSLHEAPGSKVKDKTGIAPIPAPRGAASVSTLGGWHIGISRFSDAKPEALEFVKYLTSYDGQKEMVLLLGLNPGRQDLYADREIVAKMPHFPDLKEIFQNARPRPMVPYYTQVSAIAQRKINGALAGRIPPGRALQEADEEIASLLKRYGIR